MKICSQVHERMKSFMLIIFPSGAYGLVVVAGARL